LDISVTAPSYTIHGYNFSDALVTESHDRPGILEHLHKLADVGVDHGMTIRHIADDFHWRSSWHLGAKISICVGLFIIILGIFLGCRYRYKFACARPKKSSMPSMVLTRRNLECGACADRIARMQQDNATEMADLRAKTPGVEPGSEETKSLIRMVKSEAYDAIEKVRDNLGDAVRRAADSGNLDPDAIMTDALKTSRK
jgi:hypothetical protein